MESPQGFFDLFHHCMHYMDRIWVERNATRDQFPKVRDPLSSYGPASLASGICRVSSITVHMMLQIIILAVGETHQPARWFICCHALTGDTEGLS
jgi:hypothetical protein